MSVLLRGPGRTTCSRLGEVKISSSTFNSCSSSNSEVVRRSAQGESGCSNLGTAGVPTGNSNSSDSGNLTSAPWCESRIGEENGRTCGGADEDFLDLLVPRLLRAARTLAGEGRAGDESSAPDWKMLLSSQPLSSAY